MRTSKNPIINFAQKNLALASITGAIVTSAIIFPEVWNQNELKAIQIAQEARGRREAPQKVVIFAIDSYSLSQADQADLSDQEELQKLQKWPWPREIYSLVIKRLVEAQAKAIAIDLVFDSPSLYGHTDDLKLAETLQEYNDKIILGAQIRESNVGAGSISLISPADTLLKGKEQISLGLLNGFTGNDGVVRQRPSDYRRAINPLLGASTPGSLATILLEKSGKEEKREQTQESKNSAWRSLLDPYGPPGSITTYPVWEILDKRRFERLLETGILVDSIVLIGPTAPVLQDRHSSVFGGSLGMPGVEIHATEVANRLEQRSIRFHPINKSWAAFIGLCMLISSLATNRWKRPLTKLCSHLGIAALLIGSGIVISNSIGLTLWLFSASGAVVIAGVINSSQATIQLQWQRRRLRNTLGRYLSPAVAAEIAAQPEEADGILGGKEVDVVIMMTDIRRFTATTQAMSSQGRIPELVQKLNEYFSEIVRVLHSHGATVDKFIGDACLAVFGTPLTRGASVEAAEALKAAAQIVKSLEKLNNYWESNKEEPWEQVITISYGKVISGNIGASSRMDYTVIGDAVNTASRLESIAKATNNTIVLSQAVVELLGDSSRFTDLGTFDIRGQARQHVYAWESVFSEEVQ